MKSYIVAAFAAFASTVAAADGVKGAAEGFAKGTLIFSSACMLYIHITNIDQV
jgi:pectin lyase